MVICVKTVSESNVDLHSFGMKDFSDFQSETIAGKPRKDFYSKQILLGIVHYLCDIGGG